MLANTAPDRRPSNSCDPDPHALPRYPTPYWSDTIAAFSNFLWLPNSTADHDSLINTTQSWDSKTAAHSWFSTNRIPAPDSELPKIYSSAAVQDSAIRATAGATKQQARRIQVYPDRTQKLAIATWLTASRWTYNLTVEILQSGIPGRMETHRQHGNAGISPPPRMGFGSLPGEAHGSEGRLPGHVQRQDLQLGTQGRPDTRPESRRNIRPTRLPQPPEPQAVLLHTARSIEKLTAPDSSTAGQNSRLPRLHTLDAWLGYRNYRLLWCGNFFVNSAQWLQLLSVGWLVCWR